MAIGNETNGTRPSAWGQRAAVLVIAAGLSCAGAALAQELTPSEYGPSPDLPAPEKSLLPTTKIAKAVGWPEGAKPRAIAGTVVNAYASGLSHPRWLYVLPNGDVLVAETDAPPKPDDSKGISGKVHKLVMKRAGSGSRPSANRIILLRGINDDGSAREQHVFLQDLNSPFGMALIGDNFYVADTDAVLDPGPLRDFTRALTARLVMSMIATDDNAALHNPQRLARAFAEVFGTVRR